MRVSGATPLLALDAIALDTETTGLETGSARIVQFGAVVIARGCVRRDETFETFVDPQQPIPAAAIAIHRIGEADVAGAPSFGEGWTQLREFCGGRVVIGHSIGFDIAVIEKECARAGIGFDRPRTLCVRLLSSIANPRLPDNSLDTIASWLGVAIAGRHRALGDALAAAGVFVALAPRLAERGIRTLAEAERACLALSEQLDSHHRAGWARSIPLPMAAGSATSCRARPW